MFVPATIKGDIVWRRGVKVSGKEVLVTVSTKARGFAPSCGLIFEAYDPFTCTNAALHVGKTELLKELDGNEYLLGSEKVKQTVEALALYRLSLFRDPVNGIVLSMEDKTMPRIFQHANV